MSLYGVFGFFGPQIFFLAKLPVSYLKYYTSLVSYQKSEKSNEWLPRNARKCIFFTPFSPFLAQFFSFLQNCLWYNASYGCNLSPTFVKKLWRIEFSPQKSQLYHFWCKIACRFQKCYQKYPISKLNRSKLAKYL